MRTALVIFTLIIHAFGLSQTESGELKKWHTVTVEFTAGESYSETGTPNPFLDRRLNVTFTAPSSATYVVPGYFAADGDAAETSATSGTKWHVKFTPDETGLWSYVASFRAGTDVAVTYPSSPSDGSAHTSIDGDNGSFTITATDKTGRDFRGKGRAEVVTGKRYLRFAETGTYFIKGGPDSPENLLGFNDFDDTYAGGTDYRHDYTNHVADWDTGNPQWQGTKGRGLIGAINYLADDIGVNSISFLTLNKPQGDTKDVAMHLDNAVSGVDDFTEFDVSKLAQWEIVFEHAQTKGMHLHFKTQEQENAAMLDNVSNPNGGLGTERKLYYRELIARFGHHLVLNWNMGEENNGSVAIDEVYDAQRRAQVTYVKDIDPYNHLRVVHSTSTDSGQSEVYDSLLLPPISDMTGVSLQTQVRSRVNERVKHWIDQGVAAGISWPVSADETSSGVENTDFSRKEYLYGALMAGGHGVEYYFSGQDFTLDDFRAAPNATIFQHMAYAIELFENHLPFDEMQADNSLTSSTADFVFYKPGDTYAVFRNSTASNNIDLLPDNGDSYTVKWYDALNGGALQDGTITSVTAGNNVLFGDPPSATGDDWVAIITNDSGDTPFPAGQAIPSCGCKH